MCRVFEAHHPIGYRDDPNRQMCRLYPSMMDKMGVRPGRFGDATEPFREV